MSTALVDGKGQILTPNGVDNPQLTAKTSVTGDKVSEAYSCVECSTSPSTHKK